MSARGQHRRLPRGQRGAALVVGLLLLLVLTVFAVSGMSSTTMELAMAGNSQYQSRAFEAADSVLESELGRTDLVPLDAPGPLPAIPANTNRNFRDENGETIATATATTSYVAASALAGWQLGSGSAYSAYHFETETDSTAARGATANHRQGYYVVGPDTAP